ncbi:WhiB family transcriptional regulator [Streptomyces sp. NPDC048270]|uniref:WhiB family transcriptional regulator n=1 Tax=Streptomyces sp. NPDC048270 TaxID=3154615 RepID=UPI0033DCE1A7
MDWRHKSQCRNQADVFFPNGETRDATLRVEKAKALCAQCPVIDDCRKWALTSPEEYGIWAGLDEQERIPLLPPTMQRRIRRRIDRRAS